MKNTSDKLLLSLFAFVFFALPACDDTGGGATANLSPLAQKGLQAYRANCIACHNTDPKKPGAVGPEIYGSPRELIEARVMRAEYPPGYKPKRSTHAMPPLPQLQGDIDAIHAYLNSK